MTSLLSPEQVHEFKENGVLVVSLFQQEEVELIRQQMHAFLKTKGVDHANLEETANHLSALSSTGGSGGVLDVFYEDWKLEVNQNEQIFSIMSQLWQETYASATTEYFEHPFGPFNASTGFMYIDRVGYRVPDSISRKFSVSKKKTLQRSLTPHLDCCPDNIFHSDKEFPKWRPIQLFLALTDTLEPEMGGFETCPGFHRQFKEWSQQRKTNFMKDQTSSSSTTGMTANNESSPSLCVGEFTAIRPIEDKEVIDQFRHVPCKAGDLVIWDYRLPHSNSRHNNNNIPREVIYLGFLPSIDRNKCYAEEQLRRMKNCLLPNDQWHARKDLQECSFEFSELGKQLLTLQPW